MGGVTGCEGEVTQSVVADRFFSLLFVFFFFFLEKSSESGSAERRAARRDRMTQAGGATPTALSLRV